MNDIPQHTGENPGANRPYRASYLLAGVSREEAFAALMDVPGFARWGTGVRHAWLIGDVREVRPGAGIGFEVSAAGFTHEVISIIITVEEPRILEWRYTSGAVGHGGWLVEAEGVDAVRLTFSTDYEIKPAWLDRIAHRPFFRRITEDLLRRSIRRLGQQLRSG